MLNESFPSADKPKLSWGKKFENLSVEEMEKLCCQRRDKRFLNEGWDSNAEIAPGVIHPVLGGLKNERYVPPFDLVEKHVADGDWEKWVESLSGLFREYAIDACMRSILFNKKWQNRSKDEIARDKKNLKKINEMLAGNKSNTIKNLEEHKSEDKPREAKENPNFLEYGQIWLTKNEINGKTLSYCPSMVMISGGLSGDSSIVRISPICIMSDNFADKGDVTIDEYRLLELWNEQPILVEYLDKYIYTVPQSVVEKNMVIKENFEEGSKIINCFRALEKENTEYLRSPALAKLQQIHESGKSIMKNAAKCSGNDNANEFEDFPEMSRGIYFGEGEVNDVFTRVIESGDWKEWLETITDPKDRKRMEKNCLDVIEDKKKLIGYLQRKHEKVKGMKKIKEN